MKQKHSSRSLHPLKDFMFYKDLTIWSKTFLIKSYFLTQSKLDWICWYCVTRATVEAIACPDILIFLAIHCVIILTFNFNPHLVNREKCVITVQTKYTKGITVRTSQVFFDFITPPPPPPTTQQQHNLFMAKREVYSARS